MLALESLSVWIIAAAVISCVGGLGQLFLLARYPETLMAGTQWPARLSFALLMTAIAVRGASAGRTWVPGLGLGEGILLLAGACSAIIVYLEGRHPRSRGAHALAALVTAALCSIAYRWIGGTDAAPSSPGSPDQLIELGSVWIYPHVWVSVLAYGAIAVAGALAFLQLLQDRASTNSLMGATSFAAAALMSWLVASGHSPQGRSAVTWVAALLAINAGLSVLDFRLLRKLKGFPAPWLGSRDELLSIWARALRLLYLLTWLAVAWLAFRYRAWPSVLIASAAVAFVMGLVGAVTRFRHLFEDHLPDVRSWLAESVDHWSLKATRIAVVCLGLSLLSGAVLAKSVWGRFWGWDPKETLTLALLVHFLMVALLREQRGFTRRQAATMVLCGVFLAAWAYFGANLVFPQLHVYGLPR